MPRLNQAEEGTEDASTAAEQYVEDLKDVIPAVSRQLGPTQAMYERAFDARTKDKNKTVKAGDWVCLDAHSRSSEMLGFKTQGAYMVLRTGGHRFPLERPRGLHTVSSDHVTGTPAPPVRDAMWTRAARARALFKVGDQIMKGPQFAFERLLTTVGMMKDN